MPPPWAGDLLAGVVTPRGESAPAARLADLASELPWARTLAAGPLRALHAPRRPPARAVASACLIAGHPDPGRLAGAGVDATTALAAAHGRRGLAAVADLRGTWLVAVWDAGSRRGAVAEDHLGNRPLYFAERADALLFASELPALLRLLPAAPKVDERAVAAWLVSRELPDGATLHAGVRRLGPGAALVLHADGWRRERYWAPAYRGTPPLTLPEAAERVRAGLATSVGRAVAEPGPVGLMLSGGLDSGAVASTATRRLGGGGGLRAYTATLPGAPDVDEGPLAAAVAAALGLPAETAEPAAAGALRAAADYQAAWGQPLRAPGYVIERPLLERAAAAGCVAVLDGQGGDELFGLSPYLLADLLRRGRPLAAFRLTRRFPDYAQAPAAWKTRVLLRSFGVAGALPHGAHRALVARRPGAAAGWLAPELAADVQEPALDALTWRTAAGGPRWWRWLADTLTRRRTRDGMAEYLHRRAGLHGLAARSPLLDVDLVELVLGLPPALAFGGALDRPVLREAMRGCLPDAVRLRASKGSYAHFVHDGLVAELPAIRALLDDERAAVRRWLRPEALHRALAHPPAAGQPGWVWWAPRLWGAVTAELWLRAAEG